jgi:D-alanyl-D-alanine carboxypeptidase/D-alanyl-D-alanine-endopeptidase (penicillin-binding protein 4)
MTPDIRIDLDGRWSFNEARLMVRDRTWSYWLNAWLLVMLTAFGDSALALTGPLPDNIARAAQSLGIEERAISIWIQPVGGGEPLLSFNSDEPRNPASTLKIVTTYAALEGLGPTYTWKTSVYLDELDRDGRVPGDLWIRGSGDPYFVTEEFWKLAEGLRSRGVLRIDGDLVFDNSFDKQPDRVYNVPPHPMLVNFNAVRFRVVPSDDGQSVAVSANPPLPNLELSNRLKLRASPCQGYQRGVAVAVQDAEASRDKVLLEGRFPSGCNEYSLTRTVLQPESYAYGLFDLYWRQLGGELKGAWRSQALPEGEREPFYVHQSRPLGDLIRLVNKYSNNVMTRHLELTLGAELYGAPATLDKGRRAIYEVLRRQGVETERLRIDNSAGLSRDTLISARQMGQVLSAAWRSNFMPEFVSSLSLAGLDGTTRNRFQGRRTRGRMHLKTGRLDDVSGIAGFVTADSGSRYTVAVLVNGPDAHRGLGEDLQEVVLDWVLAQ